MQDSSTCPGANLLGIFDAYRSFATPFTMRRLWGQVIQTSGASIYNVLLSIVGLFITARYLGPEGRGVLAAANSWAALFVTFGSLSLGQVIIHRAAGRQREEWLPETLGTLFVIIAVIVIACWCLIGIGYVLSGGSVFNNLTPGLLILAFAALPFMIAVDNARYILNALDALHLLNMAQVIGASLGLGAIILFVIALGWSVPGALLASVLSSFAMAGITLTYAIREARRLHFRWKVAKELLVGSLQLHLNAVGTYFFSQASILILNNFRTAQETGYYQLAMQLFGLALITSTAISTVSFGLVAQKGPDGAWPEHRRLLGQSLALVSVLALLAYVMAPLAISLVAGDKFAPSAPLFQAMLPALIGGTFSTVMASQWIGRGLFWQAALLTLVVGVLSVICNFALIPVFGMYGAVTTMLLTYGVSVVGNGMMALWVEWAWRKSQAVIV